MPVLSPPFFADCCVVVAEFVEVPEDGNCAGDRGEVFNVRDVGCEGCLGFLDYELWLLIGDRAPCIESRA